MPLFGKSAKSPSEIVKHLATTIISLEKDPKRAEKISEDISKQLQNIKILLLGNRDSTVSVVLEVVVQITTEFILQDLIELLIKNLKYIEFEARKDVVIVTAKIMSRQVGGRIPAVEYLEKKPEIFSILITGHGIAEVAQTSYQLMQEFLKHESLARHVCNELIFNLLDYSKNNDVSLMMNAHATLKMIFTTHKQLGSGFLQEYYERFFDKTIVELLDLNYLSKLHILKFIYEIFLFREYLPVTKRYINSAENLKVVMRHLSVEGKNVAFQAFQIFKLFVLNDDMSKPVHDILLQNRDKLVVFLEKFQSERSDDEPFVDERNYLVKKIKQLHART